MPNITTELASFEDINYPKSIYDLLLNLKDKPLEINVNCQNTNSSENPVIVPPTDFKKYNSEETFLRSDGYFGNIYTITLYSELFCYFNGEVPQYFIINETLTNLGINEIIDYSANLSDERKVFVMENDERREFYVKQFVNLNNLIYLDTNHAFLQIPTTYDMNDVNEIVNIVAADDRERNFKFYLTLVYTK